MSTAVVETEATYAYVKLIVRRLYDAQKLRIQSDLRLQQLQRDGALPKEYAEDAFAKAEEYDRKAEHEYERVLWGEIKDWPIITRWLGNVKGIGPRLSGLLVANIAPVERFPNVSKLWAYCGLHVIDGRAAKREKGKKSNWNSELKTTCWKVAGSFLKARSPYRELYDAYRQAIVTRELDKGSIIWKTEGEKTKVIAHAQPAVLADSPEPPKEPEWTLGRIHNMGMRWMAKLFLSHLWCVWREIEGLEVTEPYVIQILGHRDRIDPWSMIEEK